MSWAAFARQEGGAMHTWFSLQRLSGEICAAMKWKPVTAAVGQHPCDLIDRVPEGPHRKRRSCQPSGNADMLPCRPCETVLTLKALWMHYTGQGGFCA